MTRKLISAIGLLALAASHAAAVAGPVLAGHPPDCCNGTLCSTHHRHGRPAPAKPDCHQPGEAGLGDCSMRSCNPPEHRAVGAQPYLLPEPLLTSQEAPLAFEIPQAALFFPAPVADVDSPPPRPHRA